MIEPIPTPPPLAPSGGEPRKLALVTGSSRGIGAATAEALAAAGYHVVLTARTAKDLEAVEARIHDAGGTATIAPFDLLDGEAIDRLAAALGARWGRLDALILNAGTLGTLTPVPHIDLKDWDRVLGVNLTANWRMIRAFDPWLRASDAADVVAITSTVAASPRAYWGVYAASKAALENLVATYGAEVSAVTGVRTHILNPGATRTAMRARAYPGEDPAALKVPEDVAATVLGLLQR